VTASADDKLESGIEVVRVGDVSPESVVTVAGPFSGSPASITAYDAFAEEYADTFASELENKPFDRDLLGRFALKLTGRGQVWDVGCGPAGHVARYLADGGCGVVGADISLRVINVASARQLGLDFCVADMCELPVADRSLGGIVAFYSVHHLPRTQIPLALVQFRRALHAGGALLMAVHEGAGDTELAEWPGHPATVRISQMTGPELEAGLHAAGFRILECHAREPYPSEYPARRLYAWAITDG
jgi:uncharacterized UPF0146 family protein